MKKPISLCYYGQFCPELTQFRGRGMDYCGQLFSTVVNFFSTFVQYNWPYFGEISLFENALWVRRHLVSNQDSISFRQDIVQSKTSLFEKVQKPGHFLIDNHKENLWTYCCFRNYFAYVFSLLLFFSIYTNFSSLFNLSECFLLEFLQNHLVQLLFNRLIIPQGGLKQMPSKL